MSEEIKQRPIRSFVLREGRFTEGQRNAYDRCWSMFGINCVEGEKLDPTQLFSENKPLYLEIGFGNGEAMAETASRYPENNYIGIEVHRPGVGHLLLRLEELELINAKVMRHDAMEVLRHYLPDQSLDGVMLFFPDPWHKRRHHKRRIVQPEFVRLLARLIKPGGTLHMATDWEDYAKHMMQVLSSAPEFENTLSRGQFAPRPKTRPLTKFEQRGQRLGHDVWDLLFKKR